MIDAEIVANIGRIVRQRNWAAEQLEIMCDLAAQAVERLSAYDPEAARDLVAVAQERLTVDRGLLDRIL